MTTETTLRRRLAVLTTSMLAVFAFGLAAPRADASGSGSPAECKTGHQAAGTQDAMTYTAPAGYTVTGVCIKAGQLHTGLLGNGAGVCYTVAGVGSQTATVTRTGTPGPQCQGISHVDIAKTRSTTTTTAPSTTTTTQPTTTTTEAETTTTTAPSSTTSTGPSSTTSPTLPFTGPEDHAGKLALLATGLVALGVLALRTTEG